MNVEDYAPVKMPAERIDTPKKIGQIVSGTYYTTIGAVLVDTQGAVRLNPNAAVFKVQDVDACVKIIRGELDLFKVDISGVPKGYKWTISEVPSNFLYTSELNDDKN